jgi:hypothetical protein
MSTPDAGHYTKGPRKGEECVRKVFKTGSVFKQSAFDKDVGGIGRGTRTSGVLVSNVGRVNEPSP